MKTTYVSPQLDISKFEAEDIITTSSFGHNRDDNETGGAKY